MSAQYVIGIDLGTTNSVVSYSDLNCDEPSVQVLEIPQLTASHTIEQPLSLASFCYIGVAAEVSDQSLALPWNETQDFAVGEWARTRSAEVPERTVGAAKSWLCHSRVNRRESILPWNAPADVEKISPVTASRRYLEHLISAWQHRFPDVMFAEQRIVLTVPASFDPVARDLTREAAIAAGFPPDFLLLEEPQAALYAWLEDLGDQWRKKLKVDETVLVLDVGGGTTDLTLIRVVDEDGELALRREAVGSHLLVGGDNMDLTLAYYVAEKFKQQGVNLDPWQSVSLWHSCRTAKEELLSADGNDSHKISVLGRGRKLIGGTVSIEVDKQSVQDLLLNGFFPECSLDDRPQRQAASGFQEIGLPYESDPGITRHVAEFLSSHCQQNDQLQLPSHILFNGGVFKADGFRSRFLEILDSWHSEPDSQDDGVAEDPETAARSRLLDGVQDLEYSVGRGACYYQWCKEKGGTRIRGGAPASYYIGVETAGLAIPGAPRPLKALCVVPFGMEEGSDVDVPSQEIGLVMGQAVRFRFFRSANRKNDVPGTTLSHWTSEELAETDSLEATLSLANETDDQKDFDVSHVPVRFQSRITELGVFELWCVSQTTDQQWKLEFSVRGD